MGSGRHTPTEGLPTRGTYAKKCSRVRVGSNFEFSVPGEGEPSGPGRPRTRLHKAQVGPVAALAREAPVQWRYSVHSQRLVVDQELERSTAFEDEPRSWTDLLPPTELSQGSELVRGERAVQQLGPTPRFLVSHPPQGKTEHRRPATQLPE